VKEAVTRITAEAAAAIRASSTADEMASSALWGF
jgi:hypothetical protein